MPHNPSSLVDFLSSKGVDSSSDSRTRLWWRFDASKEYTKSAAQNTQLLNFLKFADETPDLILEKSRFDNGDFVFATVRSQSNVIIETELGQQQSVSASPGQRVNLGALTRTGIYSVRVQTQLRAREMALAVFARGNPLASAFDVAIWDSCVEYTAAPASLPVEAGDESLLRDFFDGLTEENFKDAFGDAAAQAFADSSRWAGLGNNAFVEGAMVTTARMPNSQWSFLRRLGTPQFTDFASVYLPLLIDEAAGLSTPQRNRLKVLLAGSVAVSTTGFNVRRLRDMGRICERIADFDRPLNNVGVKRFILEPPNNGDVTIVGAMVRNIATKTVSFMCEVVDKVGGDLTSWKELVSFRPASKIQNQVNARGKSWLVQPIEDSLGDVNLDFYPVYVTQLPAPAGAAMTAEKLLAHIRKNINSFVDDSLVTFRPYKPGDATKWQSDNPLGAVIYIEIYAPGFPIPAISDSALLVTSRSQSNHWRFSTIQGGPGATALIDEDNPAAHPVSGNRQFGFIDNGNGMYTFYTKGADRAFQWFDLALAELLGFRVADMLWRSLQGKIWEFVNNNGGCASINRSRVIWERHGWAPIENNKDVYDVSRQPDWAEIPN